MQVHNGNKPTASGIGAKRSTPKYVGLYDIAVSSWNCEKNYRLGLAGANAPAWSVYDRVTVTAPCGAVCFLSGCVQSADSANRSHSAKHYVVGVSHTMLCTGSLFS